MYERFFTGELAINIATGDEGHVAVLVDLISSRGALPESVKLQYIMSFATQQQALKRLAGNSNSKTKKYLFASFDEAKMSLDAKSLEELGEIEEEKGKEVDTCTLEEICEEWLEERKAKKGDKPITGLNPASEMAKKAKNGVGANGKAIEVKIVKPKEIEAELDKHVIGQEDAKRTLALAAFNHAKMIKHNTSETEPTPIIESSNIMVVGGSGSGKSYTIENLAKILERPFIKASAAGLTASGYAGKSVDTILAQLWAHCEGDRAKAETAIVFIDEIDKIATSKKTKEAMSKDVGGESVQMELLKVVEGAELEFQLGMGTQAINTSNILFICGGAFNNMSDEKEVIKPDDIIEYGFMREFVGRFPMIARLDRLTEDQLVDILTKPVNAITKQYQKLVEMDSNELKFDPSYLKSVAAKAYQLNTGARALKTILGQDLKDVLYESSNNVDKDYVMKVDVVEENDHEEEVKPEVNLNFS